MDFYVEDIDFYPILEEAFSFPTPFVALNPTSAELGVNIFKGAEMKNTLLFERGRGNNSGLQIRLLKCDKIMLVNHDYSPNL